MICEPYVWTSRYAGIDLSPYQASGLGDQRSPDRQQDPRKQAYCLACKEHSGRLDYIDPPFISWQCKKCVLIWLTVITNDTSVGAAIAAQALAKDDVQ